MTFLPLPVSEIEIGGDHDIEWSPYPRSNQVAYTTKKGLVDLTDVMLHVEKLLDDDEVNSDFEDVFVKAEALYKGLQT
ncbi:Transcription factor [Penicillium waksmanii]|uniref:Transcription factor n=1 Tax=Penicillium waksmanii TaxID=69791 RepID=UPI002546C3F8|nr:Transcription factor [Penicillium waksmanii]KAJ5995606.1 Transcription factor [Penicillium waksmanii]